MHTKKGSIYLERMSQTLLDGKTENIYCSQLYGWIRR